MGKASTKEKRSKSSSKSRVRKKSRTRRSKSKKDYHGDDSDWYSDDDSRSSVSISSSDSDDSYHNRRSRSRSRKLVKGSKRRLARSLSSSRDGSPRRRKRKGRNDDYKVRKKASKRDKRKKKKKKKVRRDQSISYNGSGSRSCSECQNSSDGSEYESHKYHSKRREGERRALEKTKSGSRRRHRSRSCSSCSRHSESGEEYQNDGKRDSGDRTPKRLRSVIVAKEDYDEREFNRDEQKEEMEYDNDDYPCRSADSNDAGNKRELAHKQNIEPEKKIPVEDKRGEKDGVSSIETTDLIESKGDEECQCQRNDLDYGRLATNDDAKEKGNDSANGANLETILRQKALENLRRFRGGSETNSKDADNQRDESGGEGRLLSTKRAGGIKSREDDESKVFSSFQNDEKLLDGDNVGSEAESVKKVAYPSDSTELAGRDEISATVGSGIKRAGGIKSREDDESKVCGSFQNNEKLLDGDNVGSEAESVKKVVNPSDSTELTGRDEISATVGSGNNKPRLGRSALEQALSGATTMAKGAPSDPEYNQAKEVSYDTNTKVNSFAAGDISSKDLQDEGTEILQLEQKATPENVADNVVDASNSATIEPSSSLASAASDIKSQDGGKEGQLEEKTMSVMRGGEMVQVSYKVYIPKKTPALARRKLKR